MSTELGGPLGRMAGAGAEADGGSGSGLGGGGGGGASLNSAVVFTGRPAATVTSFSNATVPGPSKRSRYVPGPMLLSTIVPSSPVVPSRRAGPSAVTVIFGSGRPWRSVTNTVIDGRAAGAGRAG